MSFGDIRTASVTGAYGIYSQQTSGAKGKKVEATQASDAVRAVKREDEETPDEQKRQKRRQQMGPQLDEEALEAVQAFATVKGLLNGSLNAGQLYQFELAPLAKEASANSVPNVQLVHVGSGKVLFSLSPAAFEDLLGKLHRHQGFLTNTEG